MKVLRFLYCLIFTVILLSFQYSYAASPEDAMGMIRENFKWRYYPDSNLEELKKKAKLNDPKGMFDYGFVIIDQSIRRGSKIDKGRKWIKKASDSGCARASLYLAGIDNYTPKEERIVLAEKIYNSSEGDCIYYMAIQWLYGLRYEYRSKFWDTDGTEFLKYLRRASSLGYAPAQYDLSLVYAFEGMPYYDSYQDKLMIIPLEVEQNPEEAYNLFSQAGGSNEEFGRWGLRKLTSVFSESENISEDQKGINILEYAFKNGDFMSGFILQEWYYNNKFFDAALRILRRLSESDSVLSHLLLPRVFCRLSSCYRFGRGCEVDEKMADYYLESAGDVSEDESLKDILKIFNESKE